MGSVPAPSVHRRTNMHTAKEFAVDRCSMAVGQQTGGWQTCALEDETCFCTGKVKLVTQSNFIVGTRYVLGQVACAVGIFKNAKYRYSSQLATGNRCFCLADKSCAKAVKRLTKRCPLPVIQKACTPKCSKA